MKILVWGFTLFFIAFLLHLIVWKVHLPKRHTKVLLQIFFGTLIMAILTLLVTSSLITNFKLFLPENISEYLYISLFFISLTLAYIITYSAIEADSPSLVMITRIAEAGPQGLDEKIFNQLMTDDVLVKPRIQDLIRDRMVYIDGDKYKLMPKGILFIRIFIIYRVLLNASKGG